MWVDFRQQKLQTGLLKMHIHSQPVGGAFGMSDIYNGFLGNGCKQSRARLINYTLSGNIKMLLKLSEDNRFPSEVHS